MIVTVFWLIIAIIIFDYLLEKFLDYLNYRNMQETIPEALKGIYEEEKYRKSQQYEKVNQAFSMVTGTFSFIIIFAFSIAALRTKELILEIPIKDAA